MRFLWDSELLCDVVQSVLLPDWEENWDSEPNRIFKLKTSENGWSLQMGDDKPEVHSDLDQLRERLKTVCHIDLGSYAPNAVFVHAGVVLTEFGLVVIPARSYSGKSTLVKSLVDLGGKYYSDEYAVIDSQGLVSPFPRALSLRQSGSPDQKTEARKLGWAEDLKPVRIATVLSSRFVVGGKWNPQDLTEGQAVLKMLENTVSAQINPEKAIRYLTTAVAGIQAIETERGDSQQAAGQLLELMTQGRKKT